MAGRNIYPTDIDFDAKGNVQFDTHLLYFPGMFILLTVLCINFVGDGLRDALDPQSGRD